MGTVPDWPPSPAPQPGPVPEAPPAPTVEPQPDSPGSDRPPSVGPGGYLVQPGDCLWDIAERSLAQDGQPIDMASVAAAVTAWWQANDYQITDPDWIYPGQVLQAPAR